MSRGRMWPPPGGPFRDERLAFFAAEAQLRRIARRGGAAISVVIALAAVGAGGPRGIYGGHQRKRLQPLVLACDEAAKKLDALERRRLRDFGELPEWFVLEVRRLAPSFRT